MSKIVDVIIVLSTIIVLVLTNFCALLYSGDFYSKEFVKYNVSVKNPDNINNMVLGYYSNKNDLDPDVFNEAEIKHLRDVKNIVQLIWYVNMVLIFLVVALLFFYRSEDRLLKLMFYSGLGSFVIFLVFSISVFINFNFLFDLMHNTLFKPGTWAFDPAFETLGMLYHPMIFYDFAVKLGVNIIISSVILASAGLI